MFIDIVLGEWVVGNKMDSNNLATLFAPNILHSCKPSGKDELSLERTEERSDAINVIRSLIDSYRSLYQVISLSYKLTQPTFFNIHAWKSYNNHLFGGHIGKSDFVKM